MDNKRLNAYAERIKAGSNDAFMRLYTETKKGVFSFVYSIVHNFQTSEEIMQDTYLRVKTHISQYREGTNFSAWLLQIAKRLAYDALEKRKREIPTDFTENDLGTYEVPRDKPMIRAVKNALDEREGQIVLLHAVSGYKHREIAKLLDMPLGTVTWSYKNAIGKLQKYLKEVEGI